MTHLNETLFSCGIACSAEGVKMPSGNYQIDMLLANVCKQNVTRFPYEIARLAEDIAGGLMVTMPSAQDLFAEKTGPMVEKLLAGQCDTPTIDRMRVLRLVENLTLGAAAVGYRTESMHGAGSPQAQRIMIARQSNMEHKKQLARELAGVGKPRRRAEGQAAASRARGAADAATGRGSTERPCGSCSAEAATRVIDRVALADELQRPTPTLAGARRRDRHLRLLALVRGASSCSSSRAARRRGRRRRATSTAGRSSPAELAAAVKRKLSTPKE